MEGFVQRLNGKESEIFARISNVSEEQIRLAELSAQGTPDWLGWRKFRLTASNFGAASGSSPYQSSFELAEQMVFGSFQGNEATEWGKIHEPVACEMYESSILAALEDSDDPPFSLLPTAPAAAHQPSPAPGTSASVSPPLSNLSESSQKEVESLESFLSELDSSELDSILGPLPPSSPPAPDRRRFRVEHKGLLIWKENPWLAASPDGIVHGLEETPGLLEIKCPFKRKLYPSIPPHYFDQIQGLMGILKLEWCDFVVWTPETMQTTRFAFDEAYWTHTLLPKLTRFYFEIFLPLAAKAELAREIIDEVVDGLPCFDAPSGERCSSSSHKRTPATADGDCVEEASAPKQPRLSSDQD